MKTLVRVVAVLFACCSSLTALAGPFGLDRGMTRDQIVQQVGKEAIAKEVPNAVGGEMLELKTVPHPHRDFESYALFISKEQGLLKVVAISQDVDTSEDGQQLKDKFGELRSALQSVYGKPSDEFAFVKSSSEWDEPKYFMMSLYKKDRTLEVDWVNKPNEPTLKDSLQIVALETKANTLEKGYFTLIYEFTGWSEYVDKLKNKESSVF